MPLRSRWNFDIPDCSLATLVFGNPTAALDDTKPVFIDADNPSGNYLTSQQHRLTSQRLAAGLRQHGFRDSDRLLLYSGNNIYFPCVLMGAVMVGGIFSGANPSYVAREVAFQLEDSGAKFLLCTAGSLQVGLEAAAACKLPLEQVFYFDNTMRGGAPRDGVRHWSELLASEEEGRRFVWDPLDKPGENERTVALNYSSGTTGKPKGESIPHQSTGSWTGQR